MNSNDLFDFEFRFIEESNFKKNRTNRKSEICIHVHREPFCDQMRCLNCLRRYVNAQYISMGLCFLYLVENETDYYAKLMKTKIQFNSSCFFDFERCGSDSKLKEYVVLPQKWVFNLIFHLAS